MAFHFVSVLNNTDSNVTRFLLLLFCHGLLLRGSSRLYFVFLYLFGHLCVVFVLHGLPTTLGCGNIHEAKRWLLWLLICHNFCSCARGVGHKRSLVRSNFRKKHLLFFSQVSCGSL